MNPNQEPDKQPSQRLHAQINDPKELTQAERIRALLERRARVIDALEATAVAHTQSAKDESDARLIFVAHLRSLILDLYPLLLSDEMQGQVSGSNGDGEDSDGNRWLNGMTIGEFSVTPPSDVPTESTDPRLQPGFEPAQAYTFKVDGLGWFLENDFPLSITWHVARAGQDSPEEISKDVLPPLNVCVSACKVTIQCMNEMGIDAKLYQDSGTFGFDYGEIESGGLESNEALDNE